MNQLLKVALLIALTCSLLLGTGLAENATLESVYNLPLDNVDFWLDPELDYLVVGYHQPISEEFMAEVEKRIVLIPNFVDGDTIGVEAATFLAFSRLQYDLRTNYGVEIALYDAYRTVADQTWLIESGLATFKTGEPGYSEHHTGLLLDVIVRAGEYYYNEAAITRDDIPEEVKTSPNFEIFRSKLADYGFILRFPEGKEDITGVPYTPSEIRFVGSSEIAHEITDNGLTLEEYVSGLN